MEKGKLKTVRERKVKFVLCAANGFGKLHFLKNGTICWRGRQWSQGVLQVHEADRCRKCPRSLAACWQSPAFAFPGRTKCQEGLMFVSPQRGTSVR